MRTNTKKTADAHVVIDTDGKILKDNTGVLRGKKILVIKASKGLRIAQTR